MFYNFHVADGFRDYLRFMWFDGNNLTKEPTTFRMTTHAFGLTSSPSCANFAMRQLAQDFVLPLINVLLISCKQDSMWMMG